jgi:guanylate kinase
VQQVKDFEFTARCIFINPPAPEILETRLKESGLSDEKVREALKTASELSQHATTPGFYDLVVDSDIKSLESAIFGNALNGVVTNGDTTTGDVNMEDAESKAA